MTKTVCILAPDMEIWILWVHAVGIEMRWTVPVRKVSRIKSMWHNPVNAMTFYPAISAKSFAHEPAMFLWIQLGSRSSHADKCIVVKFAVTAATGESIMMEIHSRHNLTANDIDPCHIFTSYCPKVMPRSGTKSGMCIIIFNHMTDIYDIMPAAPIMNFFFKTIPIEARNGIHV